MKKLKILFQGDSITDAGRDRSNPHHLGHGYPKFAAELLRNAHPDIEFEFINLGISGNRVPDLLGRLQSDFIDIQPDIVSILIGINDTWHFAGNGNIYPNDKYESEYDTVLREIKSKTNAKIIMLEQFLLYTPDKAHFRRDMSGKMEINRALARRYADAYIALDGIFAEKSVEAPPTAFAEDGVHPTDAGAIVIAEQYAAAVGRVMEK